jgi:hypothetical protein
MYDIRPITPTEEYYFHELPEEKCKKEKNTF